MSVHFINNLAGLGTDKIGPRSSKEGLDHSHDHSGNNSHSHDHGGEHGHTHEHYDHAGMYKPPSLGEPG
jgi:urease accessory protein